MSCIVDLSWIPKMPFRSLQNVTRKRKESQVLCEIIFLSVACKDRPSLCVTSWHNLSYSRSLQFKIRTRSRQLLWAGLWMPELDAGMIRILTNLNACLSWLAACKSQLEKPDMISREWGGKCVSRARFFTFSHHTSNLTQLKSVVLYRNIFCPS